MGEICRPIADRGTMQNYALVVDDDQFTLFFVEQALRPTGMQVLQAEDGFRALEILQNTTPSILFLDMLLPQVSGVELLDFVIETPRLNATCVVVLSAHNHFVPADKVSRVDSYFVKPVRPKDIRDAALHAIARQAAT